MKSQTFPYPGGKTLLAPWVIDHFPAHECYVEPCGGSASVLAAKDPASVEVYNDRDGDLVHFFTTMRDRTADLREYIQATPTSRSLYNEISTAWYNGDRPDNDVKRAAWFFYLRFTQYGGLYNKQAGFRTMSHRNIARQINDAAEKLDDLAERFSDVVIESLDVCECIRRYDSADTLHYVDPPYINEGDDLYTADTFDHAALAETLNSVEGMYCVSYYDLPPELEPDTVVERDTQANTKGDNEHKTRTERLAINYDPNECQPHTAPDVASLEDFA